MSNEAIDRSKLPIRRPPFQGKANRTLDGSEPDWNSIAPIPAPEGAPKDVLTGARVKEAFGADVHVLAHPDTGAPVVVPSAPAGRASP